MAQTAWTAAAAADRLAGGPGDDYLNGGPGSDLLMGDRGNDYIVGLTPPDRLRGGPGTDLCHTKGVAICLLGRFRPGLLTALAIAGCARRRVDILREPRLRPGAGCTPIVRTLKNGDPAVTDGAVRVPVDGLGAFGRGAVAGADAIFNPPGGFAPLGTTYTSNLYLNTAGPDARGRLRGTDQVQLLSGESAHHAASARTAPGAISQELEPVTLGGSTLRQTYTLTNTGGSE